MTGDRIERLRADATTPAAVESGEATVWTADVHAALAEVDRLGMELEEHADLLAEARREVDRLTAENTALMEGARP